MAQALQHVIVQVKDADGFWSNAAQFTSDQMKHAKKYAQFYGEQIQKTVRVVTGPNRQIIASYSIGIDPDA